MGIAGGGTTCWPNMILLHHHDCILIVDEDNVLVKMNQNSFRLLLCDAFIGNIGGWHCRYYGLSLTCRPWLANEMGW